MTNEPQPSITANPGSPYAVVHGCTCPIKDNHGSTGCGVGDLQGNPLFWINSACPLHGKTKSYQDSTEQFNDGGFEGE